MIWRPRWACARVSTKDSPFNTGGEQRPLRVTLHTPDSPTNAVEIESLSALREVVTLDVFEYADTASDSDRHLTVDPDEGAPLEGSGTYTVDHHSAHTLSTGIFWRSHWLEDADRAASAALGDRAAYRRDFCIAGAHEAQKYDLLVTTAPTLLARRVAAPLDRLNVCVPSEAVKVIGLFLRAREQWTLGTVDRCRFFVDANTFYTEMLRRAEPRLFQFGRAIGDSGGADIQRLSASIIARSRRALEARDAIGVQFHQHASWRTAEIMSYHFDYLTLLLVSAFDAAARVLKRVFQMDAAQAANFWRPSFVDALGSKASNVHRVAAARERQALKVLLYSLRNTIHEVKLDVMMYTHEQDPTVIVAKLGKYGRDVWMSTRDLGGRDTWGIVSVPDGAFEFYTYASQLIALSFAVLGQLTDAVAIDRGVDLKASGGAAARAAILGMPPALFERVGVLG